MSRVSVKDLAPGMKLARPVVNKGGLVMIGEETELTNSLIDKIQRLDVASVYVHGASKSLPPRDELMADLDRRFRRVEAEPYMALLKGTISAHIESLYEEHGPKDPEG
jgi:hypothetical protein